MSHPERIRFAQARGARILYHSGGSKGQLVVWTPRAGPAGYRIHPDDEHLQYGPLSTALRDYAIKFKWTTLYWAAIQVAEELFDTSESTINHNDWRLYVLFLAELLADEGL